MEHLLHGNISTSLIKKMWTNNNHVPMHSGHANPPVKRHHTARYYAHRVKESLTTRVSKLLCSIFLALLFFVGLVFFILWLSLRPHRPRFYVQQFSIPALAQGGAGPESAQIIYNITIRNPNQDIGIYYESMHMTVFYDDQNIGGSPLLFPFFQGPKNTTEISGQLGGAALTISAQRWQQLLSDRASGREVFRVEIRSAIKFQISTWDSKHHTMHANCEVGVGQDGVILIDYKNRRCLLYFS